MSTCIAATLILCASIFVWHGCRAEIAEQDAHVQTPLPAECEADDPLGMISGSIANWQITSSSTYPASWVKGCSEQNARLFRPNGLAWCAKFKSSSEWLQIDLGVRALPGGYITPKDVSETSTGTALVINTGTSDFYACHNANTMVTGIMTQGRGDSSEWVTSFMLSYSDDAIHWKFITDQYANQKIFEGNTDSFTVKHNYLDEPIKARYVKIHTYTWHGHPSLRVELVGCQPCKQLLGIPPYARFAASSARGKRAQRSCTPEYGHYLSNKGWCPKWQDGHQWLQVDVGPPTQITGVLLKGRGDNKRPQYVTRFKLSYSNDTRLWYFYKDATPLDPRSTIWSYEWALKADQQEKMGVTGKLFEGNSEQVLERVHYLASPFIARYVRIHPINWKNRIAMRVGLLGCRQKGPCSTGYFRINNESSCVANLAYKKSAWITPDGSNHQKRSSPLTSLSHGYHDDDVSSHSRGLTNIPEYASDHQVARPPMLANHRIGDSQTIPPSSSLKRLPLWSMGPHGHAGQLLADTGDPMASLAVDGWTGEETIIRNSTLRVRSSERLMSDDPTPKVAQEYHSPSGNKIFTRHSCTVLEYRWPFVELPSWYVDLREQVEVNGVVIHTASHGRVPDADKAPTSRLAETNKLHPENLERLSVYVESEPRTSSAGLSSTSTSNLCGFVTRLNDAIFNPRLHIPCRQPLSGRYVYVEARGMRGLWSQEFSALLCEVMVY